MDENSKDGFYQQKPSRLSFPFNSSIKENGALSTNRRHTLVPNRSILKPNMEGNNTINLISDTILKERRRVSFAPEVTLHKIDYSRSNEERRLKKRNSLNGHFQSQVPKLNTSQYIWKSYQAVDNTKSEIADQPPATNDEIQAFTSDLPNKFIIDEDSNTQTMELSAELTQELLKNHSRMKEQHLQPGKESVADQVKKQSSLQDVFEEAEQEINSDKTSENYADEVDMELTETFNKGTSNFNSSNLMEISMDLTQASNCPASNGFTLNTNEAVNTDDDNDTMEFTQPVSTMTEEPIHLERTQVEPALMMASTTFPETDMANDNDETMEFTQPVSYMSSGKEDEDVFMEEAKLSVVFEASEPPTSDQPEAIDQEVKEMSIPTQLIHSQIAPGENMAQLVHENERESKKSEDDDEKVADSSLIDNKDLTSDMETSLIATEMVPLAEVTADFTENVEDYDSDNSLVDDNHVNVSLDIFLDNVNVQFYDNIGPSDNEINQTLIFNSDLRSSPFSEISPASSSATSTSTPSSLSTTKRANLIEYIDACTNIPYYHYIVHLINQYQSSIQSISTMVNTFSNDVLESNPTAIREYYQQTEEVKVDLCTNYQAIATFTRKQAKCQNLRFLSGLLEQLISSYERANQFLESELSKALEWRRGILVNRQKMIEKKVKLNQYIQKLDTLRDNWNSINIEKIKQANESLRLHGDKKTNIKQSISDLSKLVSHKTKNVSDKKLRKERLLREVESLRKQVSSSTVPTKTDLKTLMSQLNSLEALKSIKLLPGASITLLLLDKLKAVFIKRGDDMYEVELSVNDIDSFAPFSSLLTGFIARQQKSVNQSKTVDFVKQLVESWRNFTRIWRELLTINFLYYNIITDSSFQFQFYFEDSSRPQRSKILVEGNLEDLLEPGKEVLVKLVKQDPWEDNEQLNMPHVLDRLKQTFDNKNSVINRFAIS